MLIVFIHYWSRRKNDNIQSTIKITTYNFDATNVFTYKI